MKGSVDYSALAARIKVWAKELGFQAAGISALDLAADETHLQAWLAANQHGEMAYMARHGHKRSRPEQLLPGTLRVISVRMNYFPPGISSADKILSDSCAAFVSRYALGRDYHKLMRNRLKRLSLQINEATESTTHRVFVDSAPVLEKALARNAGLGWIGKHTNLLSRDAGSWFFLGEIYTDLPLPADQPLTSHCGSCTACIDICPTQAILSPFELDARRCISYLTIELHGPIPEPLRPLIGNRIYGCDDCQLVCPWNRYATPTPEADFLPRHHLDGAHLCTLFAWTEEEFLNKTEGSPIRRIGYQRWLRNIAVALGNATSEPEIIQSLQSRADHPSELVREHVAWALRQITLETAPESPILRRLSRIREATHE